MNEAANTATLFNCAERDNTYRNVGAPSTPFFMSIDVRDRQHLNYLQSIFNEPAPYVHDTYYKIPVEKFLAFASPLVHECHELLKTAREQQKPTPADVAPNEFQTRLTELITRLQPLAAEFAEKEAGIKAQAANPHAPPGI